MPVRLSFAINSGVEPPLRYPWTADTLGLSSSRSPVSGMCRLSNNLPKDTESTLRGDMARKTHHALLVQLLSVSVVLARRALCPVVSSTCNSSPVTSIGASAPSHGQSDASVASQTACVFLMPIILWSYRLSLRVAIHVRPCRGTNLGDEQPQGEHQER